MKNKLLLFNSVIVPLFALFLVTSSAFAADKKMPSLVCAPAPALAARAETCLGNRVFIDAAEKCLKQLRDLVRKQAGGLRAGLLKDKGAAQGQNFSAAAGDYAISAATLATLLHIAALTAEEVDAYEDWIQSPVDETTEGGMALYPCYEGTQQALRSIGEDIEDIQDELGDAKDMAETSGAISGGRVHSLESVGGSSAAGSGLVVPGATSAVPASVVPVPVGRDRRGSDISGTEEKKKK